MKKWTRWQDWVGVAAGLYAAIASIWLNGTTTSMTLMMVEIVAYTVVIVSWIWILTYWFFLR